MAVYQHYYSSFVNKANGSAGFQVKAMSDGISSETESIIPRLIGYRIPPTLNEHDIKTHPIALRYYYKGAGECILLCSQSNGKDENGRPGNFFAHTLVMEPGIFTSVPPILYWRSPFWKSHDNEDRTRLDTLPSFEIEPSLDIEQIWNFLAFGRRSEQFYKLMCAVVHSNKTQRRIVIIDTNDNIALWIAAVSCMLPPEYRPLLTFATYHHDPYQAQFLITGTTSDSSFRASAEEYMMYFILNAETDRLSNTEDSLYAREAANAIRPDLYEEKLLPLFAAGTHRFPQPTQINEQLDLMVQYFKVLSPQYQQPLVHNDLDCIKVALNAFEQLSSFEDEDLEDLKQLGEVLSKAFKSQQGQDPALSLEYKRVIRLLYKHGVVTNEFLLDDLKCIVVSLVGENPSSIPFLQITRQVYGEEAFEAGINQAVYLDELNKIIDPYLKHMYGYTDEQGARALQIVWQQLGPFIRPQPQSQGLLKRSFIILDTLRRNKQSKESRALLDTMIQAIAGREKEWLQLAVNNYTKLPQNALERFYCKLVYPLELNQRLPYRNIIQGVSKEILAYELKYDMSKADPQKALGVLQQSVEHARQWQPDLAPLLIPEGLAQLQNMCSSEQWSELAPALLTSSILNPLPSQWEERLADIALSRVSLSQFSPTHIEMCKKYQNRPGLSYDTRTVIAGILAMSNGRLDQALSDRLYKHFSSLSHHDYEAEVRRFIFEFLQAPITRESHTLMISALYSWPYKDSFWQQYWETFTSKLINIPSSSQAIDLLSFWFTSLPNEFRSMYVVQYFFLELPQVLDEARKQRGFQEAARELTSNASNLRWYPILQDSFSGRKNVLFSFGQNLAQGVAMRLQKHLAGQNTDEETEKARLELEQKRMFEASVYELFAAKKIRISHERNIPKLYSSKLREQFWSVYWQNFASVLNAGGAEPALEVLGFWFDYSFEALRDYPYVAQDFFLGLYQVLDSVAKERGFRETARRINFIISKQKQDIYPWFPLVQHFFSEQSARLFRR